MNGAGWSGLLLVLVAALCALSPAAAMAGEENEEGASHLFSVQASHGYRMIVSGNADRDDGHGHVFVLLLDKGRHHAAYYLTDGYVTDTRLKANFGALGRVDLKLHASGKEGSYRVPAACGGERESYEKATYRGTFVFRGEGSFTAARAGRIEASPAAFLGLLCSKEFEIEDEEEDLKAGVAGAYLRAEMRRGRQTGVELEAVKNRPSGRTFVRASVTERRDGITIVRAVQYLVGSEAFGYDAALATATVDLPAPFSGSAKYRRGVGPAKRLTGDLAVDLPGRADVPLVRPGLKATLVPGAWSFEPPQFE